MQDKYVPWTHAMLLAEKITSDRVNLTLIKHGDHRLSREEDLVTLSAVIEGIAKVGKVFLYYTNGIRD
jgi:hypothetical protein